MFVEFCLALLPAAGMSSDAYDHALLNRSTTVLTQDYMPFCEKQCPAALGSAETTGILESDDALKAFIMKKFNRDEL